MPGAWTVHPRDKCQTATPFVVGAWAADFDADLAAASDQGKAIEPLTSIAWLFWHVGSQPARTAELDFLGGAHTAESGWTSPYIAAHPIFTTAAEAVAAMQAGWHALAAARGVHRMNSSSDRRDSGATADNPDRWERAPR